MPKVLAYLQKHGPAIVIAVVACLNVLYQQGDLHITAHWLTDVNAILAALGIGAHINNQA